MWLLQCSVAVFWLLKRPKRGEETYFKVCKAGVVHAFGTINLKIICTSDHLIHDEFYQESAAVVEETCLST